MGGKSAKELPRTIRAKFWDAIRRFQMFAPKERVLAAVSGGPDSMTLLLLLHEAQADLSLHLGVAHLHHGLRGAAADADQQFVAEWARRLGLPFFTERADVPALAEAEKIGIEEAGRRARYRFLEKIASAEGFDKIALGHTASDRAETLLLNLFRGAGLEGLRAIPPCRGRVIRPLILISRQETEAFCRHYGISPRCDETNLDVRARRNWLRLHLMPQLEQIFGPHIEEALGRAAEHLREEIEWTEPLVQTAYMKAREAAGLSLNALREMSPGLRHRVLRLWLEENFGPQLELSARVWDALERLIASGQTGKRLELAADKIVEIRYGIVRLLPLKQEQAGTSEHTNNVVELAVPGVTLLPDGQRLEAQIVDERPRSYPPAHALEAWLDADRAGNRLLLRQPRSGDRFVPLGMPGHKKLQDFFVDEKIPPEDRRPWLVVRLDGEILWIIGHRVAEAARVHETSQRILRLRLCSAAQSSAAEA